MNHTNRKTVSARSVASRASHAKPSPTAVVSALSKARQARRIALISSLSHDLAPSDFRALFGRNDLGHLIKGNLFRFEKPLHIAGIGACFHVKVSLPRNGHASPREIDCYYKSDGELVGVVHKGHFLALKRK